MKDGNNLAKLLPLNLICDRIGWINAFEVEIILVRIAWKGLKFFHIIIELLAYQLFSVGVYGICAEMKRKHHNFIITNLPTLRPRRDLAS